MTTPNQTSMLYFTILTGDTIKLGFSSKQEYESLRTNFLQRFKLSKSKAALLQIDPYGGKFLKCSWDGETKQGTFQLEEYARKLHDGVAAAVQLRKDDL